MFWLALFVGVLVVPALPSDVMVGRWLALGLCTAILLFRTRIRPWGPHFLWVALLEWVLVSFTWAVSSWDHLAGLVQWSVMALAFCVAHERDDLTPFWRGLSIAISLSAAVAVCQAFGFNPTRTLYGDGYVGLFLTKNMAAEISALALIAAAGLVATDWRRHWWCLPGPAVAAYLVHSRTVLLSVLVAGAVAAWLSVGPRWRVSIAVLGSTALVVSAAALFRYWPDVFYDGHSLLKLDDRKDIWLFALSKVTPWGDGLGAFAVGAVSLEFAHSEFIQYGFELGIGSVLIWGILFYGFSAAPLVERAVLAALLAQCAVWFPFHAPATAMVAAVVAGFLCGRRRRALDAQFGGGTGGPGSLRHRPAV